MSNPRRILAVLAVGLVVVLSLNACSNGSPVAPSDAAQTAAPSTIASSTATPSTTVAPVTTPAATTQSSLPSTSDDGAATTWMLLFLLAAGVAVALAAMLVSGRRVAPEPPPPPPPPEPPTPPWPPDRPVPQPAPPVSDFPPTIGEAQPSADEEPQLQPSSSTPSDLLVHAGKVPRKGGRDVVMRAATLRGTASRLEQKERQDAYSFVARREYLVVAVADGVGSLPHSGIAARIASRNACRRVEELLGTPGGLEDASVDRVFESTAWDVVLAARERADDPKLSAQDAARSMATTLVVGTFDIASSRDLRLTLARVGDSSAWLLRDGAAVALFDEDDDGAIVDTKTVALPGFGDEGVEIVRPALRSGDVVILATDGFAGSWGNGVGEVVDYFGAAWREPPEPITFAGQVAYRRRSFDDDRTVIAVWV